MRHSLAAVTTISCSFATVDMQSVMPTEYSGGRQRVPARGAATLVASTAGASNVERAALDEYLQALRDTGARLLHQSDSKSDLQLSAAVHDAVMEQYHAVLMNLFPRRTS
jgi:hypothetical protein